MLIPTKFSGYQAGIRLYPGGGGGGAPAPTSSQEAMSRGVMGNTMLGGGNTTTSNTSTSTSSIPQFTVDQGPTPFVGPRTPSQVGRTMPGEAPALQPIYNSQYNNYANPLTAGNVANYGTMQGPSTGYMAAMAPGGQGLGNYYQGLQQFGAQQSSQPYGMDYATFNPARKELGASQADLMAAYSYNPMQGGMGGGNFMPQMQTPFNPYTNSYQSPFSYGGGMQLPQSMYGGVYGGMGGMGGMGQQPQQYMQQQPQQYMQPQGPQVGGSFFNMGGQGRPQLTQQPSAPIAQRTSGPSQPILSRAAMARGTPNVMRRAEGGITSLLDDSE